jgi:transcriptional regulator with XRE-family HTH domain
MMTPLKRARVLKGKRQIDVYNETGIWPCRLSMIENGLIKAKQEEMQKLSEVYGTALDELVFRKKLLLTDRDVALAE